MCVKLGQHMLKNNQWDLQIIDSCFICFLYNKISKFIGVGVLFFKLQFKYKMIFFFFTLFLKDNGSMGSSAAKEMDESRMKRRMMLVKVVALMMRWQSFRNLDGIKRIRITMYYHEAWCNVGLLLKNMLKL